MSLLAALGQWLLAWSGPEGWRRRREAIAPHSKPSYDAYPDDAMPPTMRFYVEARDVRGRLLREYVDLEGYSVHQINWKAGAMRGGVQVRDWFVGQVVESMVRLGARLDEVKEVRKEFPNVAHDHKGQGLAEYALLLALIAIVAIVALVFLGSQIAQVLSTIGGSIGAQPGP